MDLFQSRIDRAFLLTNDLVSDLSEDDLQLSLPDLPSNRIGEQLWCIVGARESYLAAIEAAEWSGFSCSINDCFSKAEILQCLSDTRLRASRLMWSNFNETQTEFLFDLLEHEIQHHGQLIRYIYGNDLTFPKSWNDRYTV